MYRTTLNWRERVTGAEWIMETFSQARGERSMTVPNLSAVCKEAGWGRTLVACG